MLTITAALKIEEPEKLLEELAEHVRVRNQMGGDLWYNVMHDECCKIADKCVALGLPSQKVYQTVMNGARY
ncbi:MAG: hypothetical protein WA118_08195 [Carboxydocellales bacterium]